MSTQRPQNEWVRLANGYDVEFRHGIPVRVSDNGRPAEISTTTLLNEIREIAGLEVRIGDWTPGETDNEQEAVLAVSPAQLDEVLHRLALASAALFVDRYRKPIDRSDMDWDTQEYAEDFRLALRLCGLKSHEVNRDDYLDGYVDTMHRETERLVALAESPIVRAE